MRGLEHLDKAFVLCLGCNLVTSILVWFGKLDPPNYTLITMGTTGAYITAWAAKAIKGTPADRAASQEPSP